MYMQTQKLNIKKKSTFYTNYLHTAPSKETFSPRNIKKSYYFEEGNNFQELIQTSV